MGKHAGRKKRYLVAAIIATIAISVALYNAQQSDSYKNSKIWNFDSQENILDASIHTGSPGQTWVIKSDELAPSRPNVLAKVSGDESSTYHIKILPVGEAASSSKSSVKFKIIPGQNEQTAGLLIRFQDSSHYFVLAADALNNRFSLCRAESDRIICTQDVNINVTTNVWHTITAQVSKQGIAGYLDDKLLIQRYDHHYISGQVGVWAKGNSEAYFDDLKIDY